MGLIYLRFNTNDIIKDDGQIKESNKLFRSIEKILAGLLTSILPNANPDFDDRIKEVKQWILEVNDEDGTPQREIGLDDNGRVIMIMPWRENYGFWTDSNVQVEDLAKSHEIQFIEQKEFDNLWNEYDVDNGIR